MKKRTQAPALMETMEPRLLFSAGVEGVLLADALPAATVLSSAQAQSLIVDTQSSLTAQDADMPRQELVFVDIATPDYQQLVDDLVSARENGRQLTVYYLDSQQDGVEQITRVLSEHQGLGAIHIVSHGNDQAVQLGNTWLGNNNLKDHRNSIQTWRSALNSDADILIYGCELAGSGQGIALVDELSRLTGADIAASDDLTGQAQRGGDWEFEYRTGHIESGVVFSAELQRSWSGVLNNNPVANDDSFSVDKNSTLVVNGSKKITNNDKDADNDKLDVSLVSGPANGILTLKDTNGTFDYTPDVDFTGVDSFIYQVDDGNGGIDTATVTITVNDTGSNDAPVAVDDTATVPEGAIDYNIDLANNDTDADDGLDLTSIVITGEPGFGSISVNADGTVDYTHDGSGNFTDAFTYTIKDATGAVSNSATVNININPLNEAPVANDDGPAVVDAGNSVNINLAGNDTDADDGLDLTSIVITGEPGFGSISINADGSVDYTHDGSGNFTDSFTYTITDTTGTLSSSATVSVNIYPINDTDTVPFTNPTNDSGDNPDTSTDLETASEDGTGNEDSSPGPDTGITSTTNTAAHSETAFIEALRELSFNEDAEATDENHSIPGLDRAMFENGAHHAGLPDSPGLSFLSGLPDTNEPGEGLWDFIETMKNEMSERDSRDESLANLLAKSATGMGLTLSAGIAAWILRGGSVLASMLSSMPLWRGFDPLPIIAGSREEGNDVMPAGSTSSTEDERKAANIFDTAQIDTDCNAKECNSHD